MLVAQEVKTTHYLTQTISNSKKKAVITHVHLLIVPFDEQATDVSTLSNRELRKLRIRNIIKKYQRMQGDTGSTEVQGE